MKGRYKKYNKYKRRERPTYIRVVAHSDALSTAIN